MKNLPIGTEDFKEIIEDDLYYVDKTGSIDLIESLKSSVKVYLFSRPRRFGKTLFISMLDYFYNIENNRENKKLFNNLIISKSKYMENQGKYPVINISMKDLSAPTFDIMLEKVSNMFLPIIDKFKKINNLTENDSLLLDKMKNLNYPALSISLLTFTRLLYETYNQKVVVLIDEYEAPILNAFQNGYIDKAIRFFSNLYSSALKTNPYLEKAFITGITRITHSNIFSGLNNLKVYGLDVDSFSDSFGFTNNEVLAALKEYNLEGYKEDVKDYYDGYLFGKSEMYNPWSILNFLYEKKLKPYWTMTSSAEIISKMLIKAPNDIKQAFIELAKGKSVKLRNSDPSRIIIEDLNDPNKLFAYMISTGYITNNIDGSSRIVNKEVLHSISDISASGLYKVPSDLINLRDSLNEGYLKGVEKFLKSIFNDAYSFMDLPKNTDERTYHIAFATILYSLGIGSYKSNTESGEGRYDIAFRNFDKNKYSYIFEFKKATSLSDMDKKLDEGIKQIKDRNYIDEIKDYSKKIIVCFSFYKKEIKMKYEEII